MGMVVQHNLTAMNSNRMLGVTSSAQAKSTEKLSSGYKINRAADDAAGLSISEKMRRQIRGLTQASANAQDGISSVQTAEGALTEVHDMLQRMDELATKAANGTMSEDDRQTIQDEIDQLTTEIDRVAETTKFNEIYLLKGDAEGATQSKTLNAHDAGLKGELVDNGDGTSTFTAATLKVGDNVSIAGTDYKIIAETDTAKFVNKDTSASITPNNGDKVIKTDGTTYTYASSTSTWTGSNGTSYASNTTELVKAGDVLNGSTVIDGKNSGLADSTAVAAASTLANIQTAAKGVAASKQVELVRDGVASSYTIAVTTDLDNRKITADDFAKMIKAGDYVDLDKSADGTALYAVTDVDDDDSTITLNEAFGKMAAELKDASSIGAEKGKEASVTNNNDGTFTIEQAKTTIAKSLSFNLHVGADADMTNKITVGIDAMDSAGLGIKGLNVKDATGTAATYAIDAIEDAIKTVSQQRSALGAVQNRLEHTINNVDNVVENTTSAESQIRDTDMATEMVKYSNNNILAQAGTSMLAQANQSNQNILSLLG